MHAMFEDADAFNKNICCLDVSNVTNMSRMFRATAFNQKDLSNWNVQNVTAMYWMFEGTDAFNGNISSWDVIFLAGMSPTSVP
jgi:surface protein